MTGERTLADLVPAARQRQPSRPAVVDGDRSVTYEELDDLAGALAARLQAAGVGAGHVVAVHVPKSIEAIVALHGVLRSGAAYLPLDPAAPPDRLKASVTDAVPSVAVVDASTSAVWDAWRADGIEVPTIDIAAVEEGADGANAVITPDALAYLLYTSGSTGQPKGVEITHGNALAFVDWAVSTFEVRPEDRLSSHAPLHFDLSVFDVFGAASAAATLVLVPKVVARFPVELGQWIEAQRISVWYSVPTVLTLLVTRTDLAARDLSALRVVLFAGEVFPVRHLAALMAAVPEAAMWNLYGPTETNVCTAHHVERAPDPDDPPMPIGRPVAGDRVTIVGDDGSPVERGAIGELVVCGPTVAVGYRGSPELTDRRFSVGDDGHRCYRTGDRVREDPDGVLHFVGRGDDQVKTRGYRVELGDVEAALLRHAEVVDGAVVAVPDDVITNRLVAFVQLVPGAASTPRQLVRHLAANLPAAMVPERIEVVDRLPRTATDKIDRVDLLSRASTTS